MAELIYLPSNVTPKDIELHLSGNKTVESVEVEQYDSKSVYIRASVYNNGELYRITESETVDFEMTKKNGDGICNTCGRDADGNIIYEITSNTTAQDGWVDAQFAIYDSNGGVKRTPKFKMAIDRAALTNETVIGVPEFNALDNLIADATDAINTVVDITTAEQTRVINETVRIENEEERILNEQKRPDWVKLTQAQYDALSEEEKLSNTFYEITDDDGEVLTDLEVLASDLVEAKMAYDASVTAGSNTEVVAARKSNVTNTTYNLVGNRLDALDSQLAQTANDIEYNYVKKGEVIDGLKPKDGVKTWSELQAMTTENTVGDYYYCSDGDGINPSGNYRWTGSTWSFGGTGDEGYHLLKSDFSELDNKVNYYYDYSPVWELGSINVDGYKSENTSRIRIATPLYCKAGTKISCDKGYKFSVSVYKTASIWGERRIEVRSLGTTPYVTQNDGFVSVAIGRQNDANISNTIIETSKHIFIKWYGGSILDNTIDINRYGVFGDGVTDITDALNNALAAAKNKTLHLPEGTYLFSGTLHVPTGVRITGCGTKSALLLSNIFALDTFIWRDGSTKKAMMLFDENADGCVLENFVLIGQTTSPVDEAETGITVRGTNHSLNNLELRDINYFPSAWIGGTSGYGSVNAPAWGLCIVNANTVHVNGGHYYNCGYECIGIESSENVFLNNVKIGTACRVPLQIHRGTRGVHVNHCHIYLEQKIDSGTCGITMHGSVNKPVEEVYIDNCTIPATIQAVDGAEHKVSISDCRIQGAIYQQKGATYDTEWSIKGNYIYNMVYLHCDEVVINGNTIKNLYDPQAIYVDGNNVLVESNLLLNNKIVTIIPH